MIIKTCPGCGRMMPYGHRRCQECTAKQQPYVRRNDYDTKRTPQEVYFRNSKQWRAKRVYILARDGYQCQECKRHGRITVASEVHHIKPLWQAWDKRLDDDNLISLCHRCHGLIEPPREVPPGVGIIL